MSNGEVTLMLLYEPASAEGRPVPLVRVFDPGLAVQVATKAIREAEERAAAVHDADEFLGEVEAAEARRLRELLAILIPAINRPCAAST
jgi:hypothetical protein